MVMREMIKALMFSTLLVIGTFAVVNATFGTDLPDDTVRSITVDDGTSQCSAVVVAPGVAWTARHCGVATGFKVDSLMATEVRVVLGPNDLVEVTVPGLVCPCATPANVRPAVGEKVRVVGFGNPEAGQTRTGFQTRVILVGKVSDTPEYEGKEFGVAHDLILYSPAVLRNGDSGGGTFVQRNGEWLLVGINTIGVPDPKTYNPMAGAFGVPQAEIASGSEPVAPLMR